MPNEIRFPSAQTQLDLFTPRPQTPSWRNLPQPTRLVIENQLAALIRQHTEHLQQGKESPDER